ncbi:8-oxo-dGTP diphosphatase MutT [Mycobacterium tuberculosis]
MKSIVVAGAVIVNESRQILCALRSESMSMPGLWEFPGGKLELGETAESCLVREIEEELGCSVEVGDLIEDIVYDYPAVQVRLITHFAAITGGTPIPREHAKLEWRDVLELETLDWAPADVPTVKRLLQMRTIE